MEEEKNNNSAAAARRSARRGSIMKQNLIGELNSQPWETMGHRNHVSVVFNESTCIERCAAILEYRIVALIKEKHPPQVAETFLTVISKRGPHSTTQRRNYLKDKLYSALKEYVGYIASMYRGVNYHSVMHATHVVCSVNKLITLMQIENDPQFNDDNDDDDLKNSSSYSLGDGTSVSSTSATTTTNSAESTSSSRSEDSCNNTPKISLDKQLQLKNDSNNSCSCFGLLHDPLSHFALVFAALVHDVDHTGVCNRQLVTEGSELAILYNNLSIAEQHSLAIGFSVLFEQQFEELRDAIFPDPMDYINFMDTVNDLVMITDLGSPKIKTSKQEWLELFGDSEVDDITNTSSSSCTTNEYHPVKKRLIMECIMHVCDVAHNYQGWDNFILWNHRLFDELMTSFKDERGDDPTSGWNKGQISFFNGYILPLARRMKQSGIFPKSGGMFLDLATANAQRWQQHGERESKLMQRQTSFHLEANTFIGDD